MLQGGLPGDDPETEVIGAYLEGVKNGPAFLRALKETSRKKPVVIWKAGRTPGGGKAASSHTGSLAESKMAWEALIGIYDEITKKGTG